MTSKLKELFFLITSEQRRTFLFLQLLVIIMSIFEVVGIASIAPFMALISDITLLEDDNFLATLFTNSGIDNPQDFVFYVGVLVLLLLTIGSVLSMYTIWLLTSFGQKTGISIGNRLFEFYLNKPWLYHTSKNSASLTKQISSEANRVTNGIILPFMMLNSKVITGIFISLMLLLYDPLVALTALIIFISLYFILFRLVRLILSTSGKKVSQASEERFKIISEGFGGIKDILLLRVQDIFVGRFIKTGDILVKHHVRAIALGHVPRYFMEVVAFGSVIIFLLYLLKIHDNSISTILPIISVYALAGLKLLPAFQQSYASIAMMQASMPSFDYIKDDLKDSQFLIGNKLNRDKDTSYDLIINKSIVLKNIEYTYPNKVDSILNDLSITIDANKVIGIVGPSGSGKSTIIDIFLCLIEPDQGQILIDNKPLLKENIGSWQDKIGFVSQSIYLLDTSILENIAFGIRPSEINIDQVNKAIKLSHLSELIDELPNGFNTKVGERGVQLSGGQRQRIGIARALYHDAEILVLDEATSSLDNISEKLIMDAIHDFSGSKTVVMIAHRLTTVEKCDVIYFIDSGKVIDYGSYKDLITNNINFKKMANILE